MPIRTAAATLVLLAVVSLGELARGRPGAAPGSVHGRGAGDGQQRADGARSAPCRETAPRRWCPWRPTSPACWWGRPSLRRATPACRPWPSPPEPSPWSTWAATAARASTSATRPTARCGGPRRAWPRAGPCWPRRARCSPTTARPPRCSTRPPAAATPSARATSGRVARCSRICRAFRTTCTRTTRRGAWSARSTRSGRPWVEPAPTARVWRT